MIITQFADSGECFGLLGVNGAGKTSTFKMLTGDTGISSGDAFLRSLSLKTYMAKLYKYIGYCPQFDGLLDDLTGTETLYIYALMRGVRYGDIAMIIETLADDLNIFQHMKKRVKEFSAGDRRKLSVAVALIGDPILVYLGILVYIVYC